MARSGRNFGACLEIMDGRVEFDFHKNEAQTAAKGKGKTGTKAAAKPKTTKTANAAAGAEKDAAPKRPRKKKDALATED